MSHARNDSRMKCFYCVKIGHLAKDFYMNISDERRTKHKSHSRNFAEEPLNFDHNNIKLFVSNVMFSAKTDDLNAWFLDSRASIHMTFNKRWYENFKEASNGANIYLGVDHAYHIKGYGGILVTFPNGSVMHIHNVMYVHGIKKNMIFASRTTY